MSAGYYPINGNEYAAHPFGVSVHNIASPIHNGHYINQVPGSPVMMVPQYTTEYVQVPTIQTVTEMVPVYVQQVSPPPSPPPPLPPPSPPMLPAPPKEIIKERAVSPFRERAAPPPPPEQVFQIEAIEFYMKSRMDLSSILVRSKQLNFICF